MLSLGGIEAEINRSKVKLRLPVAQERLSVQKVKVKVDIFIVAYIAVTSDSHCDGDSHCYY